MSNKSEFIEGLNTGREIEFHYNGIPYFMGYKGKPYICNDMTKQVQYFDDIEDAKLDNMYLKDIWDEIVIDYIL